MTSVPVFYMFSDVRHPSSAFLSILDPDLSLKSSTPSKNILIYRKSVHDKRTGLDRFNITIHCGAKVGLLWFYFGFYLTQWVFYGILMTAYVITLWLFQKESCI